MKHIFLSLLCIMSLLAAGAQSKFTITNNELVLPVPIEFEVGSERIKPSSIEALEHVKAYLADKTYITLLRIEVHSDNDGDAASKQVLTEKRALAVGRWLVSEGVDCKRLLCVGFGGSKPIADNSTPSGKAQNRRVSFMNAALRDRAIGGMPVDGGGKVAGDLCK